MSTTLDVNADNRLLRFLDSFRVQEINDAGAVTRETDWESLSGEKENEISFRFDGETRTSLAVKYAFNARNQLTMQVIQQPGVTQASAAWTLQGKIFVDDVEDVEYVLLDDAGNLTGHKMEVYAALDFPAGYQQMRVKFPDKTETFITGNNKGRSLSAGEYHSGGDLSRDLLAFSAATRNTINGQDRNSPAEIKFYGRWDMHENALVFVTRYDNSSAGAPVAYLALGGQIKGTNFGLVVEQGGSFAFQINGRYEWNRNSLGWDMKVGYSKSAGLEARLEAGAKIVGKKGTLTIQGAATLKKDAQGLDLKFDLKAEYKAQNGSLAFSIQGDGKNYEIQFSGDFKIRNGNVKFVIVAANKDGVKTVKGTVEFGYYTQNAELKISLEAVLGSNGLTLKLNLEFRFYWGPNGPVAELP
jgi:hypothetical protein